MIWLSILVGVLSLCGAVAEAPTPRPTKTPTTQRPTRVPTTQRPTKVPTTQRPTKRPVTPRPTKQPTETPTAEPTKQATQSPTTVDLAISDLIDTRDPVLPDTEFTYYLSVINHSPNYLQSANDVVVVVALAPGLVFVSPSYRNSCASAGGGTVTCMFGTIYGGGSAYDDTLTVKVASSVSAITVLSTTATVTSSSSDGNADNDSAEARTTVVLPRDLLLSEFAGTPAAALPGGQVSFTANFAAAAVSSAPYTQVVFTFELSTGLSLLSVSDSEGGYFSHALSCTAGAGATATIFTCPVGQLPAGFRSTTLSVRTVVGGTLVAGTELRLLSAVVSATSPELKDVATNNGGPSTVVKVLPRDLVLKLDDLPSGTALLPGDFLQFTGLLSAVPVSSAPYTEVVLSFELSTGLSFTTTVVYRGGFDTLSCTTADGTGATRITCGMQLLSGFDFVHFFVNTVVDPTGTVVGGTELRLLSGMVSTTSPEPNVANNAVGPSTVVTLLPRDLVLDWVFFDSYTVSRGDTVYFNVDLTPVPPTSVEYTELLFTFELSTGLRFDRASSSRDSDYLTCTAGPTTTTVTCRGVRDSGCCIVTIAVRAVVKSDAAGTVRLLSAMVSTTSPEVNKANNAVGPSPGVQVWVPPTSP